MTVEPYVCRVSVDEAEAELNSYRFDDRGRVTEWSTRSSGSAATIYFDYDESGHETQRRFDTWQENSEPRLEPPQGIVLRRGDAPRTMVRERPGEHGELTRETFSYDESGRVVRVELHSRRVDNSWVLEDGGGPETLQYSESQRTTTCEWDDAGRVRFIGGVLNETYLYDEGGTARLARVEVAYDDGVREPDLAVERDGDTIILITTHEDGTQTHHRYAGQCEDVVFRPCSPAFAPAPPNREPPRLPPLE